MCGFPVFFFGGVPGLPFELAAGCWVGACDWAGCDGCVTVGGAAVGVATVVTGRCCCCGWRAHDGLP